jgi:hypothetical protein
MAQSRSYSWDKLTMRQAEWDVLDMITEFLTSSPLMKIKVMLLGNHYCLQHLIVYIHK